jgi:hypothetical protein
VPETKHLPSAVELAESCSLSLLETLYDLRFPERLRLREPFPGVEASATEAVLARLGEIHRLASEILAMLGREPAART